MDIILDSSGLKVYGEGEWKVRKHGVSEDHAKTTGWSSKGTWRISQSKTVNIALNNNYLTKLGFVAFTA